MTSPSQPPLSACIAGCMRWGKWGADFSLAEYRNMVRECLDNGITTFDHADIYGDYTTEADFGHVLHRQSALRQQMQLITKCGIKLVSSNRPQHTIKSYDTSPAHIIASVEQSLRNFNTDYLDVLLIHRPDPLTDPATLAETISQLISQGKILSFGVSNFLPRQVEAIRRYIPVSYNQTEISIVNLTAFSNGILDHCLQHSIRPMAWAPLGGGILNDDDHPGYRRIAAVAKELSVKYDTGVNQVLVAFLFRHPSGILPVIGTTKIERLIQVKEAAAIPLEAEDWFKLLQAATGEEVA
jgi:predicted oxidoreductase